MAKSNNEISKPTNDGSNLLDVMAVAHKFNISERSVWRAVQRGELLPPVRIGRCARWLPADIARFEENLVEGRKAKVQGAIRA